MTLFKLKSAPIVLIEDDSEKNTLPLLLELTQNEKNTLNLFCYEQPVFLWTNVFKHRSNVNYYEEFNTKLLDKYTSTPCSVIIDSIIQMSLLLGWNECLKYLKKLSIHPNVGKLIIVLHKDCLSPYSKLQLHLQHIASAIVSYNGQNSSKIWVQLKKGGKLVRTEEELIYDAKTDVLKSIPIVKTVKEDEEPEKPLPTNLTTFKIEVDQKDKVEKYRLKLPYMSKINEGESKVYYEPDAVDDWDEEDPDEDLDI